MKWLLKWELEDEDNHRAVKEGWATSWEEAVGYFTSWMSKTSDVIKGEVIYYFGDKPFGDGKPCLYMNIYSEAREGDEEDE